MLLPLLSFVALAVGALTLPRNRMQLVSAVFLVSTMGIATLFYAIADHFTGEGITAAVWVHLGYGLTAGELEVMRFPKLVAGVAGCILILVGWCWWCWKCWAVRKVKGHFLVSGSVAWLSIITAFALMPLYPAVLDLYILQREFSPADMRLSEDLIWTELPRANVDRRSIVYLYMESFEATFLDETLFPGLTPNLNRLRREALVVEGIATSPFMNWTMGGMVASQCGMPMMTLPKISIQKDQLAFRPGVDCLGDLLARNNYILSYIGGADLRFSGKGRFYQEHGFQSVVGYDELRTEFGQNLPHSDWGAFDDTVFKRAQHEIMKLMATGSYFGLFLLTTATHPHSGYPSPSCAVQSTVPIKNPMLYAVHCSDHQVYEFVRWLQKNGPDDLLIVVASDHLQVAGDASDLLRHSKKRENLFMVLGRGIDAKTVRRQSTMVDVAPTVASLIGFGMEGMGLGRNLLLLSKSTLAEHYGIYQFNAMLPQWRIAIDRMKNLN